MFRVKHLLLILYLFEMVLEGQVGYTRQPGGLALQRSKGRRLAAGCRVSVSGAIVKRDFLLRDQFEIPSGESGVLIVPRRR